METIPKNVLIDSLENLPDQIEVEQVIEQIILLSKIERSRRQIDNGDYSNHQDVKESYKKWLE
jgi:anti-sigma28 factor (negative regulator of flagellin synthesis)